MYHDSGIFYKNVGRLWRVSDCEELVGVTWKVSDCEELVGGYSYKDNKTNQEVLLTSSL